MHDQAEGGRRIAFFGGSFDPPHLGHIGIARAAQDLLQLDTVLFAPVGTQPLKPLGATASFEDRLAMTELAIHGLPQFVVSLADAPDPSGEPNYTIDTLHRLEAQFPSSQLFTLMGADSFLSLRRWYRGAEIPFVAPLIVASRPGQRLEDMAAILPEGLAIQEGSDTEDARPDSSLRVYAIRNQAGRSAPFYLLPELEIEISASEIRREAGEAPERLCADHRVLSAEVCDYIRAHELYR